MTRFIAGKSIDSNYFEDEINKFMEDNCIDRRSVINITERNGFTTLWYWGTEYYK